MTTTPSAYWRLFTLVSLPVFALDQATKWAVYYTIEPEEGVVEVIPGFFDLVHWYNTGAAFSMMSDSSWFFAGLSVVALIVLGILAKKNLFPDPVSRLGWALLLGGILGNLTDRLVHGAVLDFVLLRTYIPANWIPNVDPWPAFNVADACICTAAALFLWQSFREEKKPTTPESESSPLRSSPESSG